MSYIDIAGTKAVLEQLGKRMDERMFEAMIEEVKATQAEAVSLIPRKTGRTAAELAKDEAIQIDREKREILFGFLTKQQQTVWWAFILEFGRNGYAAGGTRRAGKDKKGRQRFQKVKRAIGRMEARPFMRPAAANMSRRMGDIRRIARGKGVFNWLLDDVVLPNAPTVLPAPPSK